jgi:arylsulfatase
MIRTLIERGGLDDTLVIITADHGEAFGERSEHDSTGRLAGHGIHGGLHEVKAHVPLIHRSPAQTEGVTQDSLASLIHLPEIILSEIDNQVGKSTFCTDRAIVSVDSEYEPDCLSVYSDKNRLLKYTSYGESLHATEIRNGMKLPSDHQISQSLEETAAALRDANISSPRDSGSESIAERRLRQLGYIE